MQRPHDAVGCAVCGDRWRGTGVGIFVRTLAGWLGREYTIDERIGGEMITWPRDILSFYRLCAAGIDIVVPVGLTTPYARAPVLRCGYRRLQLLHNLVSACVEPAQARRAIFLGGIVAAIGIVIAIENVDHAGFPDLDQRI